MRTRFFPAFLFLCCFLVTTSLAQKVDDPLTKKVDQLFATWDKPESPGAAIAVIKDGAVVYKRGYGSANLEYNVPIICLITSALPIFVFSKLITQRVAHV